MVNPFIPHMIGMSGDLVDVSYRSDASIVVDGTLWFAPSEPFDPQFKIGAVISDLGWFSTSEGYTDEEVLKHVPQYVGGHCWLPQREITNAPGMCKLLSLENVKSLHNCHKILNKTAITSRHLHIQPHATHLLGLLKLEHVHVLVDKFAADYIQHFIVPNRLHKMPTALAIINKHLANGRDIVACQDELLEAGFVEQAQL